MKEHGFCSNLYQIFDISILLRVNQLGKLLTTLYHYSILHLLFSSAEPQLQGMVKTDPCKRNQHYGKAS